MKLRVDLSKLLTSETSQRPIQHRLPRPLPPAPTPTYTPGILGCCGEKITPPPTRKKPLLRSDWTGTFQASIEWFGDRGSVRSWVIFYCARIFELIQRMSASPYCQV